MLELSSEDYLDDELTRRGIAFAWFGGNDIEEEGVWKWTDYTPWDSQIGNLENQAIKEEMRTASNQALSVE